VKASFFVTPSKASKQVRDYMKEKHLQDFLIVDDFYAKLDDRNRLLAIDEMIRDSELEKLNKDLLKLANDVLGNIDWDKYF
jgi:hypothetical protein